MCSSFFKVHSFWRIPSFLLSVCLASGTNSQDLSSLFESVIENNLLLNIVLTFGISVPIYFCLRTMSTKLTFPWRSFSLLKLIYVSNFLLIFKLIELSYWIDIYLLTYFFKFCVIIFIKLIIFFFFFSGFILILVFNLGILHFCIIYF